MLVSTGGLGAWLFNLCVEKGYMGAVIHTWADVADKTGTSLFLQVHFKNTPRVRCSPSLE